MSSEKGAPPVPRSNPLYGGPSGSNVGPRTPSWARRSAPSARDSNFSDVASTVPSTPPDSPARDHYARDQFGQYNPPPYESPGYTVETPGHSDSIPPSPYHAPPYYVQTPAMSERGATPLSSAPSSPPHYGPGGVPFIETKKNRSSRNNPMGKVSNGKFVPLNMLDEEDEYPNEEGDRRRKSVRNAWIISIVVIVIVLLLGLGALITWLILRPHPPKYDFQDLRINWFYLQQDKPDENGVATNVVYVNISFTFSARNPNKRYGMDFQKSDLILGYSSVDDLAVGIIHPFHLGPSSSQNFTVWTSAIRKPVYSAGHHLELDIANEYVPIIMQSNFNSHVSIVWKIITSSWSKHFDCLVNLKATLPYRFINTTCDSI